MSINTLWKIFIKAAGIWILFLVLKTIPEMLGYIVIYDPTMLAFYVLFLVIAVLVIRLFLFRPGWVIEKLALDKGFDDEKIDLNSNKTGLIRLAVIVIGGVILIDSIPLLTHECVYFFQEQMLMRESPTMSWMFAYLAQALVGYLLITNSDFVVNLIEKKQPRDEGDTTL